MNESQSLPREKLRILFVISRFLDGGIDTVLVELLKNLVRNSSTLHGTLVITHKMAGKEVFLDQIPPDVDIHYMVSERWLLWYKRRKLDGHRNHLLSLLDEVFLNPIRNYRQRRRFRRFQQNVDVVIDIDSRAHSMIDWSLLTLNIAYFHFSFQHLLDTHPHYMRRTAKGLAHYDYVVSISKEMALDRDHLLRRASEEVTHPLWYRLSHEGFMLAVERLEESQKDLTTLIEAYAVLTHKMSYVPHLVVLGEGKDRETLQSLIDQRGLTEHIHLLGFTQNPYPWMKHAQLMVHSSKFEGLPTVLIEALMLGKQIIASDCPTGPREILADGKAGILVPVGDVQALADAMHAVLTDVALQERLREGVSNQTMLFQPRENILKLMELLGE